MTEWRHKCVRMRRYAYGALNRPVSRNADAFAYNSRGEVRNATVAANASAYAYGNVMGYWDAQGNVVAEYTYDAFGKLVSSSGPMADVFAIRYSTKYFDSETGLYYYGYRFYSPELMRWVTRDPIGEEGGGNLFDEFIIKPHKTTTDGYSRKKVEDDQ